MPLPEPASASRTEGMRVRGSPLTTRTLPGPPPGRIARSEKHGRRGRLEITGRIGEALLCSPTNVIALARHCLWAVPS